MSQVGLLKELFSMALFIQYFAYVPVKNIELIVLFWFIHNL